MSPTSFLSPPALTQWSAVQLGTESYYVRPRVEAVLPASAPVPTAASRVIPATVIDLEGEQISLPRVQRSIADFLRLDDVFQSGFINGGYLIVRHSTPATQCVPLVQQQHALGQQQVETSTRVLSCIKDQHVPVDLASYLDEHDLLLCIVASDIPLAQGPYFAVDRRLHQAWRLYPDHLGAFASSVVPDDNTDIPRSEDSPRFTAFQSNAFAGLTGSVAVPSRLYFKQTPQLPLNGARISLKDNIHLNGVETTLGSRAYTELYGKQNTTAEFVKVLIKHGAVIVGKTKLSAFAGAELPPNMCIDYFPPWNPRGDGYQGPSGSSSGAAASVAGYRWVDYALCTDTTGSMRMPAAVHGLWGVRTSWNSVSMDGVVPASPSVDAISVLFRSPPVAAVLLESMNLRDVPQENWPTRIVYPSEWYTADNQAQHGITDKFVSALESLLQVKRTELNFSEEWARSGPQELRSNPLSQCMKGTAGPVTSWEIYHSFDNFRAEYQAKFGKKPYVSPSHLQRWKSGEKITQEARDAALKKTQIYTSWFNREILQIDQSGKSRTILVAPIGSSQPSYRDLSEHDGQVGGKNPAHGPTAAVSMLGPAQIIVPIGQMPYESRISDQREYLPIVTSIIGARGSEQTLLLVAHQALQLGKWPAEVLTGKTMYEVKEDKMVKPTISNL
ncbi:amidase signature domain-containing protein [Bombardia bombarda]|uniref:Amidase signature domain-containing protein n=1 Tax=Bombardia bombarda TaxID=252184 RepID=A0AA39WTS0_9PEZI|nr:amidase signature domain-containing protein [Bombardia bombarda]